MWRHRAPLDEVWAGPVIGRPHDVVAGGHPQVATAPALGRRPRGEPGSVTHPALDGVLSAARAREEGISRWLLRSGGFARVRHDVHVRADLSLEAPDVRVAVAAAALPARTVIGGWAAARLHESGVITRQLDLFDGRLPDVRPSSRTLPVLVTGEAATRVRVTAGVEVFRSVVPPEEREVIAGVPLTSPARTAFDLARLWPLVPAVAALDRLLALGLVTLEEVRGPLAERVRWNGVARGRRALGLADGGAESPRETHLRLLWQAAGFGRPLCNPVVTDARGGFVARVDLLDPDAGVVGEYDGAVHADAARRADDARRQEALEDLGLVVVRAADRDVGTAAGREAWRARLSRAYARARTRSGSWRLAPAPSCPEPLNWSMATPKRLKWSEVAPPRST